MDFDIDTKNGIVGLQAGTNRGANQSGMTFGKPRLRKKALSEEFVDVDAMKNQSTSDNKSTDVSSSSKQQ
ncbi:calponin repeat domain-containing protein [Pseudomonas sp. BGI-2]|uniref:calponin repeat domain-containing protein n=1 Tax=Pseudomonas sp. BGI-2 TaxID=2528211 RepID=UPI0013F3D911|nr:calponin repeat domain-containing protein [Pseudomonas sp. BGI-2]